MFTKCFTSALNGISAYLVTVEVHAVAGSEFALVGLPDNAVKEARDRIYAALQVNGLAIPHRMLTINMSPADLKKEGTAYDLPLAIGMLAVSEQIHSHRLEDYVMVGELSLDGTLQPTRGVLPITLMAKQQGFRGIIVPQANAREAAVVQGIEVYAMECLLDVVRFLEGEYDLQPLSIDMNNEFNTDAVPSDADFSDVRGQENVRRAMEIAAAGGHNMLMVGPPGAGKSMMAKRLPSILPPLTMEEALETTKIHSVAGLLGKNQSLVVTRPFRSPHHTITDVGLCGGSTNPRPGEISLAHNGVLFLDELPEFGKHTLEVLRQPLEDRHITIARAKNSVDYPSSFMLVAAMNPCPCGHYGDLTHTCTCTPAQVHRYKNRISGPLLDRIDIHVEIQPVPYAKLKDMQPGESSAAMRRRVISARQVQQQRFIDTLIRCNAQMTPKMVRQFCRLSAECDTRLEQAITSMGLSARAYDRILKVARTIADLDNAADIQPAHIMEAVSFRSLDRNNWGE